ncbi:hypothetical protein SAMN05660657_00560 [Geodermatophilus amargosae]|uniref:Ig-like domain-containing protein n=1 Tax=Geodermatophilus amargosae TaxID=1296565 RepID=A0A1I6XQP4_9ACTN|nr:hypothetical protein [Geodermatophilus amargosae]SFT40403.1 hypothetical protein SAMN05660657_00560 [Geodermatophilus amargosae]
MARLRVLLLALACAGCGDPSTTADPAPDAGAPPAAFTGRDPLPACPAQDLGQGGAVTGEVLACLDAGRTGDGAELAVTRPTTEGDPITSWYRARPGVPGLEVFVDGSRDRFGTGDWLRLECPGAASPDDLGDCTEDVLG